MIWNVADRALNTPELRQHMAHMNDSLALLREDRELLNRDVLVEREANTKLTEENDQVRRGSPCSAIRQTVQQRPPSLHSRKLTARVRNTNSSRYTRAN